VTAGATEPGGTRHGPGGTPEGHTPEQPAPGAADKPGAPAGTHGHDDEHLAEALGPIDWRAWGAGVLGLALGGLIGACLYVAAYHG
jgi:hypothetical protein